MTIARGSVELERLQRLQKLANLYDNLGALDCVERQQVMVLLRTMVWESPSTPKTSGYLATNTSLGLLSNEELLMGDFDVKWTCK